MQLLHSQPGYKVSFIIVFIYHCSLLFQRYDKEEELGTPQKIMEWILKVIGVTNNLPQVTGNQYYLHFINYHQFIGCFGWTAPLFFQI